MPRMFSSRPNPETDKRRKMVCDLFKGGKSQAEIRVITGFSQSAVSSYIQFLFADKNKKEGAEKSYAQICEEEKQREWEEIERKQGMQLFLHKSREKLKIKKGDEVLTSTKVSLKTLPIDEIWDSLTTEK